MHELYVWPHALWFIQIKHTDHLYDLVYYNRFESKVQIHSLDYVLPEDWYTSVCKDVAIIVDRSILHLKII